VAESPPGQADVQEPGRRDLLREARESSANRLGRLVNDLLNHVGAPVRALKQRWTRYYTDLLAGPLARGRSILLASHRPRTLALADRIVVMDHGRVVEEGAHRELLTRARGCARVVGAASGTPWASNLIGSA
jgi:ABC-type glutathione transport system ATPase component